MTKIKKPYPSRRNPLIIACILFLGLLFLVLYIKRNTFFKSRASVDGHFMTSQTPPETTSLIVKYKTNKYPVTGRNEGTIKQLRTRRAYAVSFNSAEKVNQELDELRRDKDVEYAEPDYKTTFYMVPDDSEYANQWGLHKIKMSSAWDMSQGEGVKVAVVDSGISSNHPDLANQVDSFLSVLPENVSKVDELGHGTHIAGIIAALTNNSQGIAGIAPKVRLISVKIGQYDINISNGADGIRTAVDNGAQIINISWGSKNNSQYLHEAIDYAISKDVTVVVAAGNAGNNIKDYPASYDGVISVAATDELDNRASFSTFGSWVDMAAPGVSILSTIPLPVPSYEKWDGTSMAAPHVAGVAALMKSQRNYTRQEIETTLCNSADKINGTGIFWTCGRLNAEKALGFGIAPSPFNTPAPTPFSTMQPTPAPTPLQGDCQIILDPTELKFKNNKAKLTAYINTYKKVTKVVFTPNNPSKLLIFPKTDKSEPYKTTIYMMGRARRTTDLSSNLSVIVQAYLDNNNSPSCVTSAAIVK